MKRIKKNSYYNNLYDLHTIEECLRLEEAFVKQFRKLKKKKSVEDVELKACIAAHKFLIYQTKGERYKKKKRTIDKWIVNERLRDERLAKANPPAVYCDDCGLAMKVEDKLLHDFNVKNLRVLFLFECPKCGSRKGVFDDGEEFKYKHTCPECGIGEVEVKYERKGNVITTTYSCPSCDYQDVEVIDFDKDEKERSQKRKKDKELLEKYRSKYCFTKKEGEEYLNAIERIRQLNEMMGEFERKQSDPAYQRVKKIKKLKVIDLEKLLSKVLEKEMYVNLQFGKPEIGKCVIVPFSVQEADDNREEYDGKNNLRKLIKKTLEKTNWRLMSDGISYRLGYLSGRLKGYEKEEDLVKLVKV